MSVSAAKSRVTQARAQLEAGRIGDVAGTLAAADKFLEGLPDAETAAVRADIAGLRAQLAGTMKPEDTRALHAAQGKVRQAQLAVEEENFFGLDETLAKAEEYLAQITAPPTQQMADLRAEIKRLRDRGQGVGKPAAGAAAAPAQKPGFMQMMRNAVAGPPAAAPAAPAPAVATVVGRPEPQAESPKTDELPRVGVSGSWAEIQDDITGWELEAVGPNPLPLDEPPLPRTRAAILRIRHMLDDPETRRLRRETYGDPTLDAMWRSAERTLEAAALQLNAALHLALDAAEHMPTMRRPELDRPAHIAAIADIALAGTTYREAVVARARRLAEHWEADTAARMAAAQAQYDQLVRDGAAAWPAILARSDVRPELEPTRLAARGYTVVLPGVLNRAGWDFGARDYPFAMRWNGTPLAATYEPHVLAALVHAWDELKLDVSDRIPWDVVAVVEGPDTIRARMVVVLDDQDRNLEIGKLEIWHPVDCIRLRVIALRAGPVAVGP